jgi:predicted TIM-barrel fold metal-dependent hydrolase
VTIRVFGEDAAVLAAAGAPVDDVTGIEARLVGDLDLPGRGLWMDAHVHLGRDRDGHTLDTAALVDDMSHLGIACAVCFPFDDPGPGGQFAEANDLVLRAAGDAPERVVPFLRLDPGRPWEDELARAAEAGAQGVKLHPVAQRFGPESDECIAVVRAATGLGLPVLFHAGYGARPLAGPMRAVLEGVPRARIILAHGGRGDARGLAALVAAHPAVLLDTSLASLPDLVALPPERLAFGSDRPYGDFATALHLVATAARVAGWSENQVDGVMWRNLRAWFP